MPLLRCVLLLLIGLTTVSLLASARLGDVVLITPGPALAVGPMITIDGRAAPNRRGPLYLTSVAVDPAATPLKWLLATLGQGGELQPGSTQQTAHLSVEQYRQLTSSQLDLSTGIATVVALRRAGYPARLRTDGAVITAVQPGQPADGLLQPQDRLLAVDDQPVTDPYAAASAIQRRPAGQPVAITYQRAGQTHRISLPTIALADAPGIPAIGITLRPASVAVDSPLLVHLAADQIGGASAGLIFTLAILNQLTPTDLTAGQPIAGTGTLGLDERIGPVDGVRHKVRAAERAGARYFLVPSANAAEAQAAATVIIIVPVGSLQEALDFLATLHH